MRSAIILASSLLLLPTVARAQTAEAQTAEAPPPATDSAELLRLYEDAYDAFAAGDLDAAIAKFDEVASRSVDPQRKADAEAMARRARARKDKLQGAPPPPIAPAPAGPNQEGRPLLLTASTLLSLAYYGPALPIALDVTSDKSAVALYMFTAGGGFFIPYVLTRDAPVSWGSTDLFLFGASRGPAHGALLLGLLSDGSGDHERLYVGVTAGMSFAEGLLGYGLATRYDLGAGDTHTIGNGSDFGMALGAGLTLLVDPAGDEKTFEAAILAGSLGGLAAGNWWRTQRHSTWGDAEIHRMSTALGMYISVLPLVWLEPSEERVAVLTVLGGGVGGFYLGDRLLDGKDFTAGNGFLVDLGTIAGGFIGAGVAVLVTPESSTDSADDAKLALTLSVLGAAGGYALMYTSLAPRSVATPGGGGSGSGSHVMLMPEVTPDGGKRLSLVGTF